MTPLSLHRPFWVLVLVLCAAGHAEPLQQPASGPASELQTAAEHLQKGRIREAEPLLLKLYKASPNDPGVNEAMGMLYSMKGQPQRAIPFLEKIARVRPSAQVFAALGANYGDLGREPEAAASFEKALKLDPQNLAANFSLAGLYMRQNGFARAAPLLERVVKGQPGLPEPTYLLALCYSALGRPARTRSTLLTLPAKVRDREEILLLLGSAALALNNKTEARSSFERALQLNPGSVQGAANLGALLVSAGAGEEKRGLELLEGAWKKDKTSYLAGYNLALAYRQLGKPDQSRAVLADLLTKGETGELYNLLGNVEAAAKNPKAAVDYLARAAELDPRESHYFDLGYQHLQNWTLDQAGIVFQQGTARYPQSVRLWLGLGTSSWAQAKNDEAVSAYLRAAEKSDDPRVLRFLGAAYLAIKNPRPDVVALFHRYRQARPQDPWANFYDGYCLAAAGETEPALALLRKAVELDPKLAEAHLELGNLYSRLARPEEALAAYQAAVQVNPQLQQAYYRLGQALAKAGRQAEADAALKKHENLRAQEAASLEARMRAVIASLGKKP